ncbi:nucleoside phosphorylase domain-containing protein [Aspergillus fruticulosus]
MQISCWRGSCHETGREAEGLGECYRKERGDDNAYINGRIGNHNVVVCYMPGIGKGSAASVASSLKISYKRIEVALVVGIYGGAPYLLSSGEVFLGDVIISDSVVQYDFGRQYPGGFEKKPGHHLTIDNILFEASYQHKHYGLSSPVCLCLDSTSKDICKAAVESTCTLLCCNMDQVFYIGMVASADTVMKSGEHRDRLVQSEGVVGFEMEGAGVWDNIPCIIIKGVCDYADSHKDKAWQAYAAATGAAAAKSFLEYWEPTAQEEASKFQIPLDLSAVPAIEEFIGREEELNCLWEYLQPASSQTRKVAVLHGLGGIGKTQLIQGQPIEDQVVNKEEAYSPIQGYSHCGYDVYEFFPKADHGSIMITSRLQGLTELEKPFPVQKLMHKDATQLLLHSSGFSANDIMGMGAEQDLADLSSLLDGLLLAIVIAGAFMRQTGTNFDLQSQSAPARQYWQGNIVQIWVITYKEIWKYDPTAAKLLLLFAFFDNQDIWYELIQNTLDYLNPPPWFKTAVSSKLVFKTKLKTLVEFSLVEIKQHKGSYTLHPMVQIWCYHIATSNGLMNQLQKLAFILVGYMVPNHWLDIWPEDRLKIFGAFHGLGILYSDQGKLKEAEEMYQQALAGYEKALGPDHTSTLDTVNNLGLLYSDQGKLKEAEEMYQQALAGYKKALIRLAKQKAKHDCSGAIL